MLRALHYSHTLLLETLKQFPNGVFVDATLGKGNDLHFIVSQPFFVGKGYGFDIQDDAIRQSKIKLANCSRYELIHDSHDRVAHYLAHEPYIHGAIYNLGYLPGGNHSIITNFPSTIESIRQIAHKLVLHGRIILVVYSGHPEGLREKELLFKELSTWPQEKYQVLQYGFINQRNSPPMILAIEKVGESQ